MRLRGVGGLAVVVLVVLAAAPAGASAAQRYAVPAGGSGTACTSAVPCDIFTAVESAANGDEVILASGTYSLGATQLDLTVGATVHGTAGPSRPLLTSSANVALLVSNVDAAVRDIAISYSGGNAALVVFSGAATRASATTTATGAVACAAYGSSSTLASIRNSVCRSTGTNGQGVGLISSASGPIAPYNPRISNVTAIASGSGGIGVFVNAGDFTQITLDARNVIARGAGFDVGETTSGPGSPSAVINFTSSNYATETDPNSSITNPGTAGNQTAAPQFADAAGGDFHQLAASPTRNAGTPDPAIGTLDLDGNPRTQGPAPDIGAFEYDDTPPSAAITSGPAAGAVLNTGSVTFAYSADEPSTFTCALAGSAGACSGPGDSHTVTGLGDGEHTFSVAATDANGNAGAAATRTFRVDTTAPSVEIVKRPRNRTTKTKAKFKLRVDEPGASLECKLDRKPFKPCESPVKYRRLSSRKHRFQARATDTAGNVGPPARDRWKILDI